MRISAVGLPGSGITLLPLLPAARVAAAVEARDNFHLGRVNAVDQAIGEMTETCAAHRLAHGWKLPRIFPQPLKQDFVFIKEAGR